MPWVNVRIEGEQQGRIIAAFAKLGVAREKVKFYPKRKGSPGWMGYANCEVQPPVNSEIEPQPGQTSIFTHPTAPEPTPEEVDRRAQIIGISEAEFLRRIGRAGAHHPPATPPAPAPGRTVTQPPPESPVIQPLPRPGVTNFAEEIQARPVINRPNKKKD